MPEASDTILGKEKFLRLVKVSSLELVTQLEVHMIPPLERNVEKLREEKKGTSKLPFGA